MAATTAIASLGTVLSMSDTNGGTYTPIAEVKKIGGPSLSANTKNVTHLTSPGGYEEFIGTTKSGGDVPFELNYNKTQIAALVSAFGVTKYFKITYTDGSTWTFAGVLNKLDVTAETESEVSASAGIKVAGQPTFSAAS